MKLLVVCVLSIVAGLAVGGAVTWAEFAQVKQTNIRPVVETAVADDPQPAALPGAKRPRAVVFEETFEFGQMELSTKRSHVFKIANDGDAPLTLSEPRTSCECTVGKLVDGQIPPGGEAEIDITWEATGAAGPFRKSVEMDSNDPDMPIVKFVIEGEITQAIMADPYVLKIQDLSSSQERVAMVRVFTRLDKPLDLKDIVLEDPSTADFFEVTQRAMTQEELDPHRARHGVLLTVKIETGLPLGTVQQRITLVSSDPEKPLLTVPVHGRVLGDISIIGRVWNEQRGALLWGAVTGSEGDSEELKFMVRGAHRDQVRLEVIEVDPPFLQVTPGEPAPLGKGAVVQIPLTITIPPGTGPIDRTGTQVGPSGFVRLRTNHPQSPEILVRVEFAVQ